MVEDKKRFKLADLTSEQRKTFIREAALKKDALIQIFIRDLTEDNLKTFETVPKAHRYNWMLAYNGKLPIKKANKLKCLDCSGYDRAEAANCQVRTCPLWHLRPFQKKK